MLNDDDKGRDSVVGAGGDGGDFDAFVSYVSGQGPPPDNNDDDVIRLPPLNIEEAAFVGRGGPNDSTDESEEDPLSKAEYVDVAPPRTGTAYRGGFTTMTSSENATTTSPAKKHPPSFFTNDRGNLKAVSLVVRRPCLIFWLILLLCIALSFLLFVLVFRTAENGTPFTPPTNEFDINDIRSVQYDSFRLARDDVQAMRKANENGDKVTPRQSETAGIAMWIFESEEMGDDDPNNDDTGKGVFGNVESIRAMKEAYDLFMEDPAFRSQCLLDYRVLPFGPATTENLDMNTTTEERKCVQPLTPLAMYYASEWDTEKVAYVIDELKDPTKLEMFNSLALCFTRGQYCEQVIDDVSPEDAVWATQLGANITSITSKFDMGGELVVDFNQVTELASYMIQVDVFKGFVDFGYDLGFSAENPVSHYSRGIIFWGGPLVETNLTAEEQKKKEEEEKSWGSNPEDDARKEFVKEHYLELMDDQADMSKHPTINTYYFMTAIIGDVILGIVTKDAMLALFSFAFIFIWLMINTQSWFLAIVGLMEIMFSIPVAWFIFTVVCQIKYFATLNTLALFVVAAIGADDIFIFMDAYKQSRYHLEVLTDLETRMSWVYRRTGLAMGITSWTTCAAFLCTLTTPLPGLQSFGIFAALVIFVDYVLVMTMFCTAVVIYHNRYENNSKCGCCVPCGPVVPNNTDRARFAIEGTDGEIKRDFVSEFFRTQVAGFVKMPLYRLAVFVVFLAWLGVASWQATNLEATKENEQFLNEDHPLQKSFTILNEQFPTADDDVGLKVYYVWGIDEVDRTGVNRLLEPSYFGKPVFNPEFDFNPQCQTDILSLCDMLKTDARYEDLIKRKDGLGLTYCFLEELAAFKVKGNLDDCDYVKTGGWRNETWQIDPSELASTIPDFLKRKTCFDETQMETIGSRYQNEIGWDGLEMNFAVVSLEALHLDPWGINGEDYTRNQYDQFVTIAEEQVKISQSCRGNVVMTDLDEKFVFMNNQAIYANSAITSAAYGVAIAFIVLLMSTRVFHLAFFSALTIMSVLVSVVGVMVMLGWQLGSIEATLIGIIAGFSVDYVVHLAHAYEIARGDTYSRIEEAFSDLGISVFNGMITSVGASVPLFFCQLQFFAKFGTFLCLVIAFSWIFANFVFMSLLAQLKIPLKEKGCRL